MPPANPLKPSAVNNKKRKAGPSEGSSKSGSSKVPRKTLDSFFAPRVSVSSGNTRETNIVTLNEEQRRVLKMVVDEEKNVFFTGSAGVFRGPLPSSGRPEAIAQCCIWWPIISNTYLCGWQEPESPSCFAQSLPPSARSTLANQMPCP
jgi:hypothetical protein